MYWLSTEYMWQYQTSYWTLCLISIGQLICMNQNIFGNKKEFKICFFFSLKFQIEKNKLDREFDHRKMSDDFFFQNLQLLLFLLFCCERNRYFGIKSFACVILLIISISKTIQQSIAIANLNFFMWLMMIMI